VPKYLPVRDRCPQRRADQLTAGLALERVLLPGGGDHTTPPGHRIREV